MRALRWWLAAPLQALGWLCVFVGDAGYEAGAFLGELADRIRGPP